MIVHQQHSLWFFMYMIQTNYKAYSNVLGWHLDFRVEGWVHESIQVTTC